MTGFNVALERHCDKYFLIMELNNIVYIYTKYYLKMIAQHNIIES